MKNHLRTLHIDLDTKEHSFEKTPVSSLSLEEKLGGFGKAVHDIETHLLENRITDAYNQDNLFCIDLGAFTGGNLSTGLRAIFSGLSPMKTSKAGTNGVFYSAASAEFGSKIRYNNLDSIRILGKSDIPVILVIDNENVSFENVEEAYFGKTTSEKIKLLAEKHEDSAFAVIGNAAENNVRYASIAVSTTDLLKNDSKHMRYAGRGGMGAVLHSKNIYGIVVRGDKSNRLQLEGAIEFNKEMLADERTKKYRTLESGGTFFGNIETMELLVKGNIHRNFSEGTNPLTSNLFYETIVDKYDVKKKACLGCVIGCWREISKEGKTLGKLDFEPGGLLGWNLGLYDMGQIMELINIVDESGMDSISTGGSLSYLLEKEGKFGDFDYIKKTLHEIVEGTHPLKEGVFRYSNNDTEIAMHTKGIEFPAYPGPLNPGYAFSIAGQHMTMGTYTSAWNNKTKNTVPEWIEFIINGPKIIIDDFTGMCKFAKSPLEDIARFYGMVYGESITPEQIKETAFLVNARARRIDYNQGFTHEDDVLPGRCHQDLGLGVKHFNTHEFFEEVKKGVYENEKKIFEKL